MIIKSYEIHKTDLANKIVLLYGKNDGHKKEVIKNINKNRYALFNYDQNEIIENKTILFENIFSGSLFDEKKLIIINRVNDKFLSIIEQINQNKINDLIILLIADILEKKSKLRSKFEKDKNFITIPFYEDTEEVLIKLAHDFFKRKKNSISNKIINLIIQKCNGDRGILLNELNKIEIYSGNGKIITEENISKLVNLIENHNISKLVDNYLAKNNNKIKNILNENNFSNEECIIITRTFLNKAKKLLKLSNEFEKNNNIELTISSAKPPIFWKDKEITKQQIYKWSPLKIRSLIYDLNEIEIQIKKNINIAINLTINFILDNKYMEINN